MACDFDKIIDRRSSDSDKWNTIRSRTNPYKLEKTSIYKTEDAIPMWLADMDFEAPPEIYGALKNRIDQKVFGYAGISSGYYESVSNWMKRRHNWIVDTDWICPILGDVTFLSLIIKAFTKENDSILVQTPAYNAFLNSVKDCGRVLVENPLLFDENLNRYFIDFDSFEEDVVKHSVKLFILCSPHTPTGRVWTKDELLKVAEICNKYGVLVLSDEVHSDIVYSWSKFIPYASLESGISDKWIICSNPTKAFSLAGFPITNIIIKSETLRNIFIKESAISGLKGLGTFSPIITETAYNCCEEYLYELLKYLEENINLLCSYIKDNIPEIEVIRPDGTYLVWLDFRKAVKNVNSLNEKLVIECRLVFEDGALFGASGIGFQRVNIAVQRTVLLNALERLLKLRSEI